MRARFLALGLALCASRPAMADFVVKGDDLKLDLNVPDLPAMSAIGVSGAKVSHPGSVRDLVLALANGITPTGGIQSGLAIEISPATMALWSADGREATKTMNVLLRGLRLSLATSAVVKGKDTTSYVAGGVRWSISDADYNLHELEQCLSAALPPPPVTPGPDDPPPIVPPTPTPPKEETSVLLEACRTAYQRSHLAVSSFQIAAAASGSALNDIRLTALSADTVSVWVSFSYGVNSLRDDFNQFTNRLQGAARGALRKQLEQEKPLLQTFAERRAVGFEPLLFARIDMHHASSGFDGSRDLSVSCACRWFGIAAASTSRVA